MNTTSARTRQYDDKVIFRFQDEDFVAVSHGDLIINPGAESERLLARARALGLQPRLTCAIVEIGVSPSSL